MSNYISQDTVGSTVLSLLEPLSANETLKEDTYIVILSGECPQVIKCDLTGCFY